MSSVVSKGEVLDNLVVNIERFSWLNTILAQVQKELKNGSPYAISQAKKLADIAHYLSDDYANVLDLEREELDAELKLGGQQNA